MRNRAPSQDPRDLVHPLGCPACASFTGPDATACREALRSGCGGSPAVCGALQMRPSLRPPRCCQMAGTTNFLGCGPIVCMYLCVHVSVINCLSDTLSLPRVPWVWSGCSTIFLVPVPPVCIDIEWTNVLSHVRVLSAVWCGTSFVWHTHPNV